MMAQVVVGSSRPVNGRELNKFLAGPPPEADLPNGKRMAIRRV